MNQEPLPGEPEPGYYAIDMSALNLAELARMHGLIRLPQTWLLCRSIPPVGRSWIPLSVREILCRPEDLSARFHELTAGHRTALAELGFEPCFAAKQAPEHDLECLDHGFLVFLDRTRSQVGWLAYARTRRAGDLPPLEAVTLNFLAQVGTERVQFLDSHLTFDPAPGTRQVVVRRATPAELHRRFADDLRRSSIPPQPFADTEELLSWAHRRAERTMDHLLERGVYVRLGGKEIAALPTPAIPSPRRTGWRRHLLWITPLAALLLYNWGSSWLLRRSRDWTPALDKMSELLLARRPHREARAWLAEGRPGDPRSLGEQTPEESRRIVDDLYRRGAVDVQAADIVTGRGLGQTSNHLVVQLPDDLARRRALFEVERTVAAHEGLEPMPDQGQRLMLLRRFEATIWQKLSRLGGR